MESFQDIMRGRQQEGFVGRGGELAQFAANLTLPVNDPARRFVFSVHGDGGVGKSTLLNELRQIAIGRSALCAGVDEHLFGLPETMNGLACDLQAQKAKLPNFSKLYSTYLRRLTEAQSDPGAPDGLAHFVTRTAVRAGLNAAQAVPVAGLAAAAVDSEEAAQQADRLRAFLGSKFRKHEDVRMLMSPADVLTPALTRDLASVGGARALVLFFDTYEQTGPVVDPWLRSMLEGRFGSLPANLVIVIAGREPLDQASWASFLTVVAEAPLMPFTEIEARQLLAAEGVTGEHKVAEILSASGRLPLLVAMLAQSVREKGGGSTDPSDDAVGRFLAGEADPVRRGIALTAAVPRTVNEDILSLLIGPSPADQAGGLYEWLRSRTFVTHQGGRCQYHDVVRSMMLRQLRGQSPQRWQTAHERLAGHYRAVRTSTSTSDEDSWGNPDWEQAAAEETYHRLCADSHRVLPDALDQVIQACAHNSAAASRWARMIRTAGQDAEAPPVAALGRQLEDSLVSDDGDGVIACLGIIVDAANLRPSSLAAALRTRGRALYLRGPEAEALADLDRAIAMSPSDAQALAYRAEAHRYRGRFAQASADIDRALQADPCSAWAMLARGRLNHERARYDDALTDINRAIELDPSFGRALVSRSQTYRQLKRYDDALADTNRAIALDPGSALAITERGETYRQMKRYDDALTDLNRAIELDPTDAWAISSRGETYRQMERDDDALADLNRAIELDPSYAWAIAHRGEAYRVMERYDDALTDLSQAIELDPGYAWAISQRGQTYQHLERYDEALADLSRAVELDPTDVWAISSRGETYRLLDRFDDALADLNHVIGLNPGYAWAIGTRGQTYQHMERYDDALADFNHAIELDPTLTWAFGSRGQTYRSLERHDDALADFNHVIELNPTSAWSIAQRGETHRLLARYEDALADLNHAIELDPVLDWAIDCRDQVLGALGEAADA